VSGHYGNGHSHRLSLSQGVPSLQYHRKRVAKSYPTLREAYVFPPGSAYISLPRLGWYRRMSDGYCRQTAGQCRLREQHSQIQITCRLSNQRHWSALVSGTNPFVNPRQFTVFTETVNGRIGEGGLNSNGYQRRTLT